MARMGSVQFAAAALLEGLADPRAGPLPRLGPLADRAYRALKALILGNQLRGGEYILEEDLAKAAGMSRTPLRAALVQLQTEHLITIVPRRGIRVVPITIADITEIYTILECLEACAASCLARRPDRHAALAELERIVVGMRQALQRNDLGAWDKANDRFHKRLIEASGNRRLCKLCENLLDQSQRVRSMTLHLRKLPTRATDAQAAMLRAIKAGDADKAASIQVEHKQAWRAELHAILLRLQLPHV